MATKTDDFQEQKLFQLVRELNVSPDRVVKFLESQGYDDALSGSGLNAKIVDEEAYLVLREKYADDAEAASRIRELRTQEVTDSHSGRGAAPEAIPEVQENYSDTDEQKTTIQRSEDTSPELKNDNDAGLEEKRFTIEYGDTGYSYDSLFGPYLENANSIVVEDPYIRSRHQVKNFTRFCETAVRKGNIEEIELYTYYNEGESNQKSILQKQFKELKRSLNRNGVIFNFYFDDEIHDREVIIDSQWHIWIGRGLDIYQTPNGLCCIGTYDFDLRPCKKTKVDIFYK